MKITETTTPTDIRKYITGNWANRAVTVKFHKKNGDERIMNVRLNPDCLVSHVNDEAVQKRRETNKVNNNMVVSEVLDDGTYQTRTIPLEKVFEID